MFQGIRNTLVRLIVSILVSISLVAPVPGRAAWPPPAPAGTAPTAVSYGSGPATTMCRAQWDFVGRMTPEASRNWREIGPMETEFTHLRNELVTLIDKQRADIAAGTASPDHKIAMQDVPDGVLWNLHLGGSLIDPNNIRLEDLIAMRQRVDRILRLLDEAGRRGKAFPGDLVSTTDPEEIARLLKDPNFTRDRQWKEIKMKVCAGVGAALAGFVGIGRSIAIWNDPNGRIERVLVAEADKTTIHNREEHFKKVRQLARKIYEAEYDRSYYPSGTKEQQAKRREETVAKNVEEFVKRHEKKLEEMEKDKRHPATFTYNAREYRYDALADKGAYYLNDYLSELTIGNEAPSSSSLNKEYKDFSSGYSHSVKNFTPEELMRRKQEGSDDFNWSLPKGIGITVASAGLGGLMAYLGCQGKEMRDRNRVKDPNIVLPPHLKAFQPVGLKGTENGGPREVIWSGANHGDEHSDLLLVISATSSEPAMHLIGLRYNTKFNYRVDEEKLAREKKIKDAAVEISQRADRHLYDIDDRVTKAVGASRAAADTRVAGEAEITYAAGNPLADFTSAKLAVETIRSKSQAIQLLQQEIDRLYLDARAATERARTKSYQDPATAPTMDKQTKTDADAVAKLLEEITAKRKKQSEELEAMQNELVKLRAIARVAPPPTKPGAPPPPPFNPLPQLADVEKRFIPHYFGGTFDEALKPIRAIFLKAAQFSPPLTEAETNRFLNLADPKRSTQRTRTDVKDLDDLLNQFRWERAQAAEERARLTGSGPAASTLPSLRASSFWTPVEAVNAMERQFINHYFGNHFDGDLAPYKAVFAEARAFVPPLNETELQRFLDQANPTISKIYTRTDTKDLERVLAAIRWERAGKTLKPDLRPVVDVNAPAGRLVDPVDQKLTAMRDRFIHFYFPGSFDEKLTPIKKVFADAMAIKPPLTAAELKRFLDAADPTVSGRFQRDDVKDLELVLNQIELARTKGKSVLAPQPVQVGAVPGMPLSTKQYDNTKTLTDLERTFTGHYFGGQFDEKVQPVQAVFERARKLNLTDKELKDFVALADPGQSKVITRTDVKDLTALLDQLELARITGSRPQPNYSPIVVPKPPKKPKPPKVDPATAGGPPKQERPSKLSIPYTGDPNSDAGKLFAKAVDEQVARDFLKPENLQYLPADVVKAAQAARNVAVSAKKTILGANAAENNPEVEVAGRIAETKVVSEYVGAHRADFWTLRVPGAPEPAPVAPANGAQPPAKEAAKPPTTGAAAPPAIVGTAVLGGNGIPGSKLAPDSAPPPVAPGGGSK